MYKIELMIRMSDDERERHVEVTTHLCELDDAIAIFFDKCATHRKLKTAALHLMHVRDNEYAIAQTLARFNREGL